MRCWHRPGAEIHDRPSLKSSGWDVTGAASATLRPRPGAAAPFRVGLGYQGQRAACRRCGSRDRAEHRLLSFAPPCGRASLANAIGQCPGACLTEPQCGWANSATHPSPTSTSSRHRVTWAVLGGVHPVYSVDVSPASAARVPASSIGSVASTVRQGASYPRFASAPSGRPPGPQAGMPAGQATARHGALGPARTPDPGRCR